MGVQKSGSGENRGEKTKEFREPGEFSYREQAKYDLGSREQRGNFRPGAGSMGPPLQGLIFYPFHLSVSQR